MRTLCVLIVCWVICNASFAQTLPEIYDSNTLYLSFGGYFLKGEHHRFGFFGNKLKADMELSREGRVLFAQCQRQRVGSILSMTFGLGLMVAAGYSLDNNLHLATALYGASVGCFIVSFPLSTRSTDNLHKAIWIRNRDALFP